VPPSHAIHPLCHHATLDPLAPHARHNCLGLPFPTRTESYSPWTKEIENEQERKVYPQTIELNQILTKLDSNLIQEIDFARVLALHPLRLSPPIYSPTDAPRNPTPSHRLRPSSSPTPHSTVASRAWPPMQEASPGCCRPVLTLAAARDPQRAATLRKETPPPAQATFVVLSDSHPPLL
jgi:hypothetical protein